MNKSLIENAIENLFRKNLDWLKNEAFIYKDSDSEFRAEVVPFDRVLETCDQIIKEVVDTICGDSE